MSFIRKLEKVYNLTDKELAKYMDLDLYQVKKLHYIPIGDLSVDFLLIFMHKFDLEFEEMIDLDKKQDINIAFDYEIDSKIQNKLNMESE